MKKIIFGFFVLYIILLSQLSITRAMGPIEAPGKHTYDPSTGRHSCYCNDDTNTCTCVI